MYKRILMSMLAFGLAAFLMGGATMAWFTSTTQSTVTLQSGKVEIGVSGPAAAGDPVPPPVTWSANYSNMAPGQMVNTTMVVKNTGTLPMKYRVWVEIGSGSHAGLGHILELVVKDHTGATLTPLTAPRLDAFGTDVAVVLDGGHVLAPGATENLLFEVTLPTSAGNAVANKSVNAIFHFDATQPGNTGWIE